jgi:hypothetical protein
VGEARDIFTEINLRSRPTRVTVMGWTRRPDGLVITLQSRQRIEDLTRKAKLKAQASP